MERHNGQPVNGLNWITQGQSFENEYWFERTQFGGRAHPYNRPYAFEGHANQFLAILSMCGVELDQTFGTSSGPITMRDMIKHAQMTVSTTDEPTWTLWGLSRYLPPSARWKNAEGEIWSIEKLVQTQCAKPIVRGAPCGGTHALFALAHARNVYQQQGRPLRGVWLQAEYKIRQFINTARMQQNSNGTLSSDFFRGRKYDPDFNKRMASAGHVLEFLMIALPQQELNSLWVRRALEATSRDLMNNRKAYVKCSPLYHSVNALNIYLDRVNPKLTPDELANHFEETRTAELPRTAPGAGNLKPVPATSIASTRELADDADNEDMEILLDTDVAVISPVESPSPTKATAPVEVIDVNEAASSEMEPVTDIPLIREPLVSNEAVEKDRDKWKATPEARRTPINLPGEDEATTIRNTTPNSDNVNARLISDPEVEKPEVTVEEVLKKPTEELIEPNADSIEKPMEKAEEPVEVEEQPVGLGLPVKSVSTSRVLDRSGPGLPATTSVPENLASVPADTNTAFVDSELDAEAWVEKFEVDTREVFAAQNEIVDAIGLTDGMSVADVGCGTGLFVKALSSAVGETGRVFAIDISPRFVEYVERRVESEDLQNVDVVRNEPTSLMLMQHKVDRVLVCDTYHHFEHHQEMLASIFDALRSGGQLIVVDYDRVPGVSRDWVLQKVLANRQTVKDEITAAGFEYIGEVLVPEFEENYLLRFRKPGLE